MSSALPNYHSDSHGQVKIVEILTRQLTSDHGHFNGDCSGLGAEIPCIFKCVIMVIKEMRSRGRILNQLLMPLYLTVQTAYN